MNDSTSIYRNPGSHGFDATVQTDGSIGKVLRADDGADRRDLRPVVREQIDLPGGFVLTRGRFGCSLAQKRPDGSLQSLRGDYQQQLDLLMTEALKQQAQQPAQRHSLLPAQGLEEVTAGSESLPS